MASTSSKVWHEPNYSKKKLICSRCSALFALVDNNERNRSFYVFEMHEMINWSIKAKWPKRNVRVIRVSDSRLIVCTSCKKQIGIYQEGKVCLLLFRIKSVACEFVFVLFFMYL